MMQSFILVSRTDALIANYLSDFYQKYHIDPRDQLIIAEEGTIGIASIRALQLSAYIKPFQGDKKSIVIAHAETLTTEAQNALLKLLEEPPSHLSLFLTAITDSHFLPTILSRCQIVFLQGEKQEMSAERRDQLINQIVTLQKNNVRDKLVLAENLANTKDELTAWFIDTLTLLREHMISNPESLLYPQLITKLQESFMLFQSTNVSPRVILEHTFLTL